MSADRSQKYKVLMGPFSFRNESGQEETVETGEIFSGLHPDSAEHELAHGSIVEYVEEDEDDYPEPEEDS